MTISSKIILTTASADEGNEYFLDHFNDWTKKNNYRWGYRLNKSDDLNIYCGHLKNFTHLEDELAAYVFQYVWDYPESVVLIIYPEDEPVKVFRIDDLPNILAELARNNYCIEGEAENSPQSLLER